MEGEGLTEEGEEVDEIEPERQNKGGLLFILKLEQLRSFPSRSPMNRLLDRRH